MKIDKTTRNSILIIGGVAAGYFLVLKPLLVKLGLQKSAEEKELERQEAAATASYVRETLRKQKPTKTAGEWALIAGQIYEDLKYSAIDDNKSDAAFQVSRVKNDADVATLIQQFGKRQEYFFGLAVGDLKTLPQFITSNLSRSQIAAVNDNYRRKNIKFSF